MLECIFSHCMTTRRNVLYTVGTVGTITGLAGCSDQQPAEEENEVEEPTEETESENEAETGGPLDDISLQYVEFRYGFSSGLTTRVNMRYQADDGSERFYTLVEVYVDGQVVGDNSRWENIGAGRTTEIELVIEELTALGEYDLDDLTQVVVSGRRDGGELVEFDSFSGDEVRQRVDE